MDFLRFSPISATVSTRRHRFWPLLALPLLGGGACGFSGLAHAQNTPTTRQKPAALPAPALSIAPELVPVVLPTAPDIKILLIAIDEFPVPRARATVPLAAPLAAPIAPTVPDAIVPVPITPDAIVPVFPAVPPVPVVPAGAAPFLTPMSGTPTPFQPLWAAQIWVAQAQKKPKVDRDADLFRREPETGTTLPKKGVKPLTVAPDSAAPTLPASDGMIPYVADPPGRARMAALPLRDALLSLGWRDVALTSPTSSLITDALNERRLTPRALDALQEALAQLAVPGTVPSPEATRRATLAATRVGQALGYRAVAVLHVAPPTPKEGLQSADFSLILADSARENGEPILFDERGADESSLRQAGASTAAALLNKTLRSWPDVPSQTRLDLAATHLANARALIVRGDAAGAQDELNQTVALDASQSEPFVLLGDLLAPSDASGAATAYRRAVEINARDGATLAKIAIAMSSSAIPDWPRALDAGLKAIATGFDSVQLRVALATAQFGRADLFRKAERIERAEDAEIDARKHLDRALELAPDDPIAVRLLARELVTARRFKEAAQTLDRVAPRYPNDLEIQTQYALALGGQVGREEDTFVAYARVWKLSGAPRVDVDAVKYRALVQGFDARLFNLGKNGVQLTTGVANAAIPREDALIQLTKLKEEVIDAENAISILRPPASVAPDGPAARQFAAGLMSQSLEQQQIFLETGQSQARLRGAQFYTQAVTQLNAARGAR